MEIIYEYHEGSQATKPLEIDATSSSTVVYLRKNIHQITKNEDGQTTALWAYEEAELTHEEYIKYSSEDLIPLLNKEIISLNTSQQEQDDIIIELLSSL